MQPWTLRAQSLSVAGSLAVDAGLRVAATARQWVRSNAEEGEV
jgi:hypothetical protein